MADAISYKNENTQKPASICKESWPRALISPQRGGDHSKTTNGIMECWNDGILGMKSGPPQAD